MGASISSLVFDIFKMGSILSLFSEAKAEPVNANLPTGIRQVNDAVWELYRPVNVKATPEVEIIFFHGLQLGDYKDAFWKTFLARYDENVVWPKHWLGERKFSKARISSISYDSSARANDGQMDMYKLGENLVQDIILDRRNLGQSCPVILVGHSLGGLFIKQFILSAMREFHFANLERERDKKEKIGKFLDNFKGVFYYATPHGGARPADFAKLIPGTSPYVRFLQTLDTERQRINWEFGKQRESRKTSAFCIAEGLPTTYMGWVRRLVVEEGSARMDTDGYYTDQRADHFNVCRAENMETSTCFVKLAEFISTAVQGSTLTEEATLAEEDLR